MIESGTGGGNAEECPGKGLCHGCLNWCGNCGDVSIVCDTRLRYEHCAEHPVPAPGHIIKSARQAAEKMVRDGQELVRKGQQALSEVVYAEHHRRAYDRQIAEISEQDLNNFEKMCRSHARHVAEQELIDFKEKP